MVQQSENINEQQLVTPILFLIFNRPETTSQVFEAIRKARPAKLYIVGDGPREDRPQEVEKCEETRKVIQRIDWPCEIHTLFREKNLGCGLGITSAINWFFEYESEGIILEDDCLPSQSFFKFCSELLEKYRHDSRVIEIGGNNYEKPLQREKEYSYTFSHLTYIWGWATWKRAWQYHDFKMTKFNEIKEKKYLDQFYDTFHERDFFGYIFKKMFDGDHQTNRKNIWDYQWQFACHINSGCVIVPNRNLVKNIGFGVEATNTTSLKGVGRDMELEEINFPLHHPDFVMVNRKRDKRNFQLMHTSMLSRMKASAKQIIPKSVIEKLLKPLRDIFDRNQRQTLSQDFFNKEVQNRV
jgi:hypothetical protein